MHILQEIARFSNSQQDNWNAFGCNVSETLLLETAQMIVDYGLRDVGYYYVILDDCVSVPVLLTIYPPCSTSLDIFCSQKFQ